MARDYGTLGKGRSAARRTAPPKRVVARRYPVPPIGTFRTHSGDRDIERHGGRLDVFRFVWLARWPRSLVAAQLTWCPLLPLDDARIGCVPASLSLKTSSSESGELEGCPRVVVEEENGRAVECDLGFLRLLHFAVSG